MCPGWVKTDMTGFNPEAPLTPDEGAETAVWLALLPPGSKHHGGFFKNKKEKPWAEI
jgi:hypothetical protein